MQNLLSDTIKKYKHLCDYIEIRIEDYEDLDITINTEKTLIENSLEMGGNVRVLINGGWGFTSFNDLNLLPEFAEKAIVQAKITGKSKTILASVPQVIDEVKADFITDPRGISLKDKNKFLDNYNKLILNYDRNIIKKSGIIYHEQFKKKYFANSEGTFIYQELPDIYMFIKVTGVENNITQILSEVAGSSNDFNVCSGMEERIEKTCSNVIKCLRAPAVKRGVYTVVMDSYLAGLLAHESFGHACEADRHYRDKSLREEMKPGRVMGSKILNIYDTGLDRGTRGHMKYDDEGVRTEKTYLIKKGILYGRLHSRETAAGLGEKTTGSARAVNYKFPPICRMRNTCIEGGESDFAHMLKDIKLGIYAVINNGGLGGQYFTIIPAFAYMIRNGEIAEVVRQVKLSGNLFETLKHIDMLGKDFKILNSGGGCGKDGQSPLPITKGGPSIRIQHMSVGGEA
jgi:TldD protein